MEEFYIDVELSLGMTRIQVDEVPPEDWDIPFTPQFVIEFYDGQSFVTLTLQLEQGKWYDRDTRYTEEDFHNRYFELGIKAQNSNYQSILSEANIVEIGEAISRHMVVHLTTYMGMFIPVFRTPTLN
jgi:hypothetical protein